MGKTVGNISIQKVNQPEDTGRFDNDGKNYLFWKQSASGLEFVFLSCDKKIRALEFMDFFLDDCGMCKGDSSRATGIVSDTMMHMLVERNEYASIEEYFEQRVRAYFEECDWIYASQFDVTELPKELVKEYHKKKIPWYFVKTADIGNVGEKIRVKSLENESGLTLHIANDLYIMIGCRGEVYDICKSKFENTYEETDEKLDIFKQMLDFFPEIQMESTGEYINLDEKARLCYPNQKHSILAVQLKKHTKVFYGDTEEEYFVGQEGDFLAIRKDDLHDIYIIKKSIFLQTYEEIG